MAEFASPKGVGLTTAIVGIGNIGGAGRIEAPGGDLHQFGLNGELIDLDQARAAVAAEPWR